MVFDIPAGERMLHKMVPMNIAAEELEELVVHKTVAAVHLGHQLPQHLDLDTSCLRKNKQYSKVNRIRTKENCNYPVVESGYPLKYS